MTRGQCRFQGEFSDLGIPHAPRGGETFFTQHCRGQTLVHPLLRSSAKRGPEGVLCRCLGSWGWALHGADGARIRWVPAPPPSERRQKPQGRLVFVHCTETCVGALVKNVNGAAPLSVWGWGSGSLNPDPECVTGGPGGTRTAHRSGPGCRGSPGPSKCSGSLDFCRLEGEMFTLPLPPGQKRQRSNKPIGLRFLGSFTCPEAERCLESGRCGWFALQNHLPGLWVGLHEPAPPWNGRGRGLLVAGLGVAGPVSRVTVARKRWG